MSSGVVRNVGVVDSYFDGANNVGGVVASNSGSINNSYNTGAVSATNYVGGVASELAGSIDNCFYNTDVTCTKCSTIEGTDMSAKDFHNGSVASLLLNWCKKNSDECKNGDLNGYIWGQNLSAENSLPDFSGVVGSYGGVAFDGLNGGNAASADIDATSKVSVNIPKNITVTGPVKFKRSFVNEGYSTIMLPFKPNFTADDDTIVGVNFCEFAKYANNKIERPQLARRI